MARLSWVAFGSYLILLKGWTRALLKEEREGIFQEGLSILGCALQKKFKMIKNKIKNKK
jgi:hypothetical protein